MNQAAGTFAGNTLQLSVSVTVDSQTIVCPSTIRISSCKRQTANPPNLPAAATMRRPATASAAARKSSISSALLHAGDVQSPSSLLSLHVPPQLRHYCYSYPSSSSPHAAGSESKDDRRCRHRHQHVSIRVYSSGTSILSQEIKITQTSASSPSSPTSSSNDTTNDNDKKADDDNPFAQKAEERILEMQSHIRTHYRHAAYSEALETSHQLLDACQKLFGDNHPATASAYNNIGLMHKALGQFDDSHTNYTKALELYGDIVGADHASYAAALNNLGNLDRAQAHVDEDLDVAQRLELNESAVRYFDDALAIRVVELGDDHPNTVTSRSNLGGALAALVLLRHAAAAEKAKARTESNGEEEKSSSSADDATDTGSGGGKVDGRGWEAAEDHLR